MLSYIHKMNIKNSSNRFGELSHVEGGAALNNQNKIQKYDICEVAIPNFISNSPPLFSRKKSVIFRVKCAFLELFFKY